MKKIVNIILCSFLLFSTVAFVGCEKKDTVSITNKEKLESLKLPKEKDDFIDIDIYFDGSKASKEVQVVKEERLINKEDVIGEMIIQELIKGPAVKSELKPILPKDTRLLSFSIKDGIAYINLSKEAKVSMDPNKELTCLKSIAASVTQLPSIEKIKISIESKNVDTLGGTYDISKPFGKGEIDGLKKK